MLWHTICCSSITRSLWHVVCYCSMHRPLRHMLWGTVGCGAGWLVVRQRADDDAVSRPRSQRRVLSVCARIALVLMAYSSHSSKCMALRTSVWYMVSAGDSGTAAAAVSPAGRLVSGNPGNLRAGTVVAHAGPGDDVARVLLKPDEQHGQRTSGVGELICSCTAIVVLVRFSM